nr:zinc finger, CCHC-type [Tanacetum cinerariifolium]
MSKPTKRYYLLPGKEEPLSTCKLKKFITKVMFLAAVARPRFDMSGNEIFSGMIGIFAFTTLGPAKRSVLPTVRAKWPQGHTGPIFIQQDNAKPHIDVNDAEFLQEASRDGFNIRLRFQPPNSPNLNVCNLVTPGARGLRNIDGLVFAVERSFERMSSRELNNVFLTLQTCMKEITEVRGSNNYQTPHIDKARLERQGRLPLQIACDENLINQYFVVIMAGNTVKEMTTNFGKLDKFEGHDFRRWQKKMHFLLTTLKVVYVLTTPMPELLEDATVEAIRIKAKWENDDYICKGHILNGMSDSLFDVYMNVESAKELWDSLESKYMAEDSLNSVYMSSSSTVVNTSLWHARLGHVHYKRMLEMSKDELILAIDENSKKCTTCNKKYVITFIDDASRFCYVYLLHAKDEALDKFKIYKTQVELQQNDLIKTLRTDRGGEYYDPIFFQSVGVIHETTAPYTPQQNGVAERKNRALKEMVNSMLSYSGLSEGFWGEAMLTACYLLNRVPNKRNKTTPYEIWNDHSDDVPNEIPEPRKGKRVQKAKSYGSDFQLYLVEGSRDQKEAIDDEIGSIMENNTWVLSDLPPGCKPLGCKWIFKRKMKVDGTVDKFQARLVIQGFRQKERIDYFDTYAPVARITTIILLLALAAIHNLVIHQMNVKTAFLNGDLDEEVYMKQLEGFIMPGNGHKVCKLVKSLYGLKQAPRQWHQKFDEVVLSSGFHFNQSDKCVYSKFDYSGKGVIICLYVDDMLNFCTDQNQVDKTKKFLSSRFSMKDMGEADVILGIKIKRENKGIVITQSYYIEKIPKKFNREDCSPVSTPMDPVEKLNPNTRKPVDQLEYSRAIGCLMYAMTSTRPDIAYAVGRLSRFTGNPSRQHWKAIIRIFKYLRCAKNYGLSYVGYPSVLEGAISWASKKQTCITGSTMESEFVALAAAGKETEWLRNLIHEIPI